MKPNDRIDEQREGNLQDDLYQEWIRTASQWIKEARAFDKWCRITYFYSPEIYDQLTGANRAYIGDLESAIRNLRERLGEHLSKGNGTQVSDWFESAGRRDMGHAQEGIDDNRGPDEPGQVDSSHADSDFFGGSGSEDRVLQPGNVEGATDGADHSSYDRDRRKADKARLGKRQDTGKREVFTGLHPKFEDLI